MSTRTTDRADLVGAEGFESPPLPCNGSAPPLSYAPRFRDRKIQIGRDGGSPACDGLLPPRSGRSNLWFVKVTRTCTSRLNYSFTARVRWIRPRRSSHCFDSIKYPFFHR